MVTTPKPNFLTWFSLNVVINLTMRNLKYVIGIIILITINSCKLKSSIVEIKYIYTISMGPGEGNPYEIIYRSKNIKTRISGATYLNSDTSNIDNGYLIKNIETNKWNSLVKSIDIKEFFSLDNRIGCPGCRDEPVKTIEIKTSNKSHRVSYSFQPPDQLKDLMKLIGE